MKLLETTLLVSALCVTGALAHPANPFVKKHVQSDGSTLSVRTLGDEHYHFVQTADGLLVERDSAGDFVYVGNDGLRSGVKAKDPALRDSRETAFVAGIDQAAAREAYRAKKGERFRNQNVAYDAAAADYSYDATGTAVKRKRPRAENWVMGERWFPVLLVSTPKQAAVDSARMWRFFNEEGYSDSEGNIGSVRDFYLESSNGNFSPHFDIFPITISKELVQYVNSANDSLYENELTKEGVDLLVKRADFDVDKYVSNKNKKLVDGFIFLFPGREEDVLVYSEDFWAHQFWMQANGSNNVFRAPFGYKPNNFGYVFDKYLLIAQLEDADNDLYRAGNLNKFGIFVHEFAHVLGLMDHYGVRDSGEDELGAASYDLMSLGMYNENGRIPAKFNAFERETMGWMTLSELTTADTGVIMLGDIDQGQAYSVTNPSDKDEYFIVEYRPAKGYDTGITHGQDYAYNGVWVWYIKYELEAWENNNINGMGNFNRVDIKASLLSGTWGSKTSYSPLVYKSETASPVPGVFNFVKADDSFVCFTLDASVKVAKCESPVPASSAGSSSSQSSSSVEAVSSSSETAKSSSSAEAVSSATFAVQTQVPPQFSMSLGGRRLAVNAQTNGTKTVRIFDMQGNEVMRSAFAGESAVMDLSGLGRGHFAIMVSTRGKSLGIRTLRLNFD